jgi:type II secretory pathway pseudopilin PulG
MMTRPTVLKAFTMVELLAAISVTVILASLVWTGYHRAVSQAHRAACVSNLRTIGVAIHCLAADRSGRLWTRDEIGNSSYRQADCRFGLPYILRDYLPNMKVWLCPAGRPNLKQFGNNYAWSRAANVVDKPMVNSQNTRTTVLLWDNHTFLLPSVKDVPEPISGGPRAANSIYRRWPHGMGTTLSWLYLDGHVETK